MDFEETLIDGLFILGAVPKYVILLQEQGNRPFCEGIVLLWYPGIASLQCSGPDMHSMDDRQRGVGRLLPAVNGKCNVFKLFCFSPEKKGPDDTDIGQKNYLEPAAQTDT